MQGVCNCVQGVGRLAKQRVGKNNMFGLLIVYCFKNNLCKNKRIGKNECLCVLCVQLCMLCVRGFRGGRRFGGRMLGM